jgi:hypothetical protein
MNILDFVLLVIQATNITADFFAGQSSDNVMHFRAIRLFKMLRIIRLIKFADHVKTLNCLCRCVAETFMSVFWAFSLLVALFFLFSLVICAGIASAVQDGHDEFAWAFGSVQTGMLSLLQATTGGRDWGDYFELLHHIGISGEEWIFLASILFMQIVVMNIILGVFVEKATQTLAPDEVEEAHMRLLADKKMEADLRRLCNAADVSKAGRMKVADWKKAVGSSPLREYLYIFGLPEHHMLTLIRMLAADADGHVSIHDFVQGCMRLKGGASSFDMNTVLFDMLSVKDTLVKEIKSVKALVLPYAHRGRAHYSHQDQAN